MESKDKNNWIKAVQEEHDRMIKCRVWVMKKKPNRSYRARINARGFEQLDGLHYDSLSTSSPVTKRQKSIA
jgi:hypothetical protein